MAEELANDEFVTLLEISTRDREIPRAYILSASNKGYYFLTFDGGYNQKFKDKRLERLWMKVKTIAAILNALAILALGAYTVYLSDKTHKLEKENENLKMEVQKNR